MDVYGKIRCVEVTCLYEVLIGFLQQRRSILMHSFGYLLASIATADLQGLYIKLFFFFFLNALMTYLFCHLFRSLRHQRYVTKP